VVTTLREESTEMPTRVEYRKYKYRADSPVLLGFPAISLTSFRQMGAFFDAFIHPPGTRLWRHIPLPLMLGPFA
jgi:hypothetical protein